MPMQTALIIVGVVSAFGGFALVLAAADLYTAKAKPTVKQDRIA